MAFSMAALLERASQGGGGSSTGGGPGVGASDPGAAAGSCEEEYGRAWMQGSADTIDIDALESSLSSMALSASMRKSGGGGLSLTGMSFDDGWSMAGVDDFEVLHTLGEGAFGRVYLASHKESGQELAVKVMRKEHLVKSGQVDNFRREIEILSALDTALGIEFVCVFHNIVNAYIVTEFVPGGELLTHICYQKRLDPAVAAFYAAELACFLQHLHETGIVYCDVKPENVLLDAQGHIKVCDFGFSVFVSDLGEMTPAPRGTPEYMAPEVVSRGEISPAADWWSLGIFVHELLIGATPWAAQPDVAAVMSAIVSGPVVLPDELGAPARALLTALLVTDPIKRAGSDFAALKASPFFKAIDWDTLTIGPAPLVPVLSSPNDAYFPPVPHDALDWVTRPILPNGQEDISGYDPYAEIFSSIC